MEHISNTMVIELVKLAIYNICGRFTIDKHIELINVQL